MRFEIDLDLIEEMAECIYDCPWVSAEEIAVYMKSCITNRDYEPDEWSFDGKGLIEKSRELVIEQESNK